MREMSANLSLTTIVLTYNEELHIRRCLENVCAFSDKVYVVDCYSTDHTADICYGFSNVTVIQHPWPGNQAEQFNWALNNISIDTEWILRIDADEYLSEALVHEIKEKLPKLSNDITGCILRRELVFMDKHIRFGKVRPVRLLRLWRVGKGVIENRLMDEHTVLIEGNAIRLKGVFYDHNLNGIDAWVRKHLDYSSRELATLDSALRGSQCEGQMAERDSRKSRYYSLPRYHRAFWFFVVRYILLGGFLDGKAGFVWNFMQCWWYRTLVDVKMEELDKRSISK